MLVATIRMCLRKSYRVLDCLLSFIATVRRGMPQVALLNKNRQTAGSVVEINHVTMPRWDTFQTLADVGK